MSKTINSNLRSEAHNTKCAYLYHQLSSIISTNMLLLLSSQRALSLLTSTTLTTESIISTYFHYSYHREHYLYLLPLLLSQRALSRYIPIFSRSSCVNLSRFAATSARDVLRGVSVTVNGGLPVRRPSGNILYATFIP